MRDGIVVKVPVTKAKLPEVSAHTCKFSAKALSLWDQEGTQNTLTSQSN